MLSNGVCNILNLCLEGGAGLLKCGGHVLIQQEDNTDVWHHVDHVGSEPFVHPSHALFPARGENAGNAWLSTSPISFLHARMV